LEEIQTHYGQLTSNKVARREKIKKHIAIYRNQISGLVKELKNVLQPKSSSILDVSQTSL
jgi:hypothetical protein